MAQQNTVVGFYNVPLTPSQYTLATQSAILTPAASGVYAGIPSPQFPLSTSTYPAAFYISVPPESNPFVTGSTSEFDGHPFEVRATLKLTAAAGGATTLVFGLYQATNAVLSGGPASSAYSVVPGLSGTGVTALQYLASAVSTAEGVSATFSFQGSYIWDSSSKILEEINTPTIWTGGSSESLTATTHVASLGLSDLNFLLGVTFGTTLPQSATLTEFVINRL